MKLTAKKVPFSSIVGQSVTLHDASGRAVCQLAILNPQGDGEYKQRSEQYADLLVALFAAQNQK